MEWDQPVAAAAAASAAGIGPAAAASAGQLPTFTSWAEQCHENNKGTITLHDLWGMMLGAVPCECMLQGQRGWWVRCTVVCGGDVTAVAAREAEIAMGKRHFISQLARLSGSPACPCLPCLRTRRTCMPLLICPARLPASLFGSAGP